jgi:hypothetical protein
MHMAKRRRGKVVIAVIRHSLVSTKSVFQKTTPRRGAQYISVIVARIIDLMFASHLRPRLRHCLVVPNSTRVIKTNFYPQTARAMTFPTLSTPPLLDKKRSFAPHPLNLHRPMLRTRMTDITSDPGIHQRHTQIREDLWRRSFEYISSQIKEDRHHISDLS